MWLFTVLSLIPLSPGGVRLKAQDAGNARAQAGAEASKEMAPLARESLIGRWKSVTGGFNGLPVGDLARDLMDVGSGPPEAA